MLAMANSYIILCNRIYLYFNYDWDIMLNICGIASVTSGIGKTYTTPLQI